MDRVNEIRQQIEAAVSEALPQLNNPSKTAEYKQWINVFANIQATAEKIIELDKAEIAAIVDNSHIGTAEWYVRLAKQFQWNKEIDYKPVVNPVTGAIGYEIVNPADRIVTQASCSVSKGVLTLKVATGDPGKLEKIPADIISKLNAYLQSLKVAGVNIKPASYPPDIIELRADIHYDPSYSTANLKELITAALNRYAMELSYDGVMLRNSVIDAIQSIDGVVDVELRDVVDSENPSNNLYALKVEGKNERIGRSYLTLGGYINFKQDNDFPALTFIKNNSTEDND